MSDQELMEDLVRIAKEEGMWIESENGEDISYTTGQMRRYINYFLERRYRINQRINGSTTKEEVDAVKSDVEKEMEGHANSRRSYTWDFVRNKIVPDADRNYTWDRDEQGAYRRYDWNHEYDDEDDEKEFSELIGKTITKIENIDNNRLRFYARDNNKNNFIYVLYHSQECCEGVYIESITGDLDDLIGSPILLAEEVKSEESQQPDYGLVEQWTFYKLATIKGYVDIRWHGESNGCYSMGVDFKGRQVNIS